MKIFPHMWFNLVANSELKYLQTKPLEHKMNLYVRIMSSGRNISSGVDSKLLFLKEPVTS